MEAKLLKISKGKAQISALEHVVLELRSATNKLNAMLKFQSSRIAKVRGIANKMKALSKFHWLNSTRFVNSYPKCHKYDTKMICIISIHVLFKLKNFEFYFVSY